MSTQTLTSKDDQRGGHQVVAGKEHSKTGIFESQVCFGSVTTTSIKPQRACTQSLAVYALGILQGRSKRMPNLAKGPHLPNVHPTNSGDARTVKGGTIPATD